MTTRTTANHDDMGPAGGPEAAPAHRARARDGARGTPERWLEAALSAHADLGPLIQRLALGAVMIAHALAKLLVFTLPGTEKFFEGVGYPAWTVLPVVLVELVGGAALVMGLGTRTVALLLVPIMLGALRVHLGNGWTFTGQGGGWEYPAFLVAALLVQALIGPGRYAVGRRIGS